MERVIKFRAWDVENEQMYFSDNPTGTDEQIWTIGDMGQPVCLVLTTSLKSMGDNVEEAEDYIPVEQILMQFSGLTDRNGKDIYEGDILNMENGTRNPYTVSWDNDLFAFLIDGASPMGNPQFMSLYKDDIEVIGNIHEGIK